MFIIRGVPPKLTGTRRHWSVPPVFPCLGPVFTPLAGVSQEIVPIRCGLEAVGQLEAVLLVLQPHPGKQFSALGHLHQWICTCLLPARLVFLQLVLGKNAVTVLALLVSREVKKPALLYSPVWVLVFYFMVHTEHLQLKGGKQ